MVINRFINPNDMKNVINNQQYAQIFTLNAGTYCWYNGVPLVVADNLHYGYFILCVSMQDFNYRLIHQDEEVLYTETGYFNAHNLIRIADQWAPINGTYSDIKRVYKASQNRPAFQFL